MVVTKATDSTSIYTVGTLHYNKQQLFILFFWLMWNDFSIMLIEQVINLNNVLMRNHGATFTEMALLGSIGGFLTPWINPWISTWSDRHRGRFGRRRPFLFVAAPIFACFLAAIPFMPDLYRYLSHYQVILSIAAHFPMNGEVLFIGICGLACGMFNAVLLAVFSYLYWDVVPAKVLGRFQSFSNNATLIAGFVWSFFIIGMADRHMKAVYVGTSIFFITVYLLSVWKINEGKYPPPDPRKKGGAFTPVIAYFIECYSKPYFLWIFSASLLYQLGNLGNQYQFFYLYQDLKLDMGTIGWSQGSAKLVSTGFGLLLGFVIGSITDRLNPVRLLSYCYIALAVIQFGSFYFVHDKWTYLYAFCLLNMALFTHGIVIGAFIVEVFPREKLGQFCSAQAVFYQIISSMINPLIGMLFDHLKNNRLGYLWASFFYLLAAFAYAKVYFNWKKTPRQTPLPQSDVSSSSTASSLA